MICKNCGTDAQNNKYCPRCGALVYGDTQQPTGDGSHTKALVFGILGLAFCETGILGLIFSIIGLSKANNYIRNFGNVSNQVRIGKRLSIAGLIVSIVMIVLVITLVSLLIYFAANHPDDLKRFFNEFEREYKYTYRI